MFLPGIIYRHPCIIAASWRSRAERNHRKAGEVRSAALHRGPEGETKTIGYHRFDYSDQSHLQT